MSTPTSVSAPTGASLSAVTCPEWERVAFGVPCPRCGADLHGRGEPTCPRCALALDWADVLPVDELRCAHCRYQLYGLTTPRCPECGEAFEWPRVLEAARLERQYGCAELFEYGWRKPVSSAFRTWLRCWRPKRLWSGLSLSAEPRVKALVVLVLMCLAVHALVMFTLAPLPLVVYVAGRDANWAGLRPFLQVAWHAVVSREFVQTCGVFVWYTAVWWLSTLGGLLIFQESRRRHRVRNVHLVRVAVYSVLPALAVPALALASLGVIVPLRLLDDEESFMFAVPVLAGLLAANSIRSAFRWYLRIPGAAVAGVLVQVVSLLSTFVLGSLLADRCFGTHWLDGVESVLSWLVRH